jgi:hypothetical protein
VNGYTDSQQPGDPGRVSEEVTHLMPSFKSQAGKLKREADKLQREVNRSKRKLSSAIRKAKRSR